MHGELFVTSLFSFGFAKIGNSALVILLWLSFAYLFLIPIVDRCVYPLLGTYCPSLFQRFGAGLLLCISATAAMMAANLNIDKFYALLFVAAIILPFAEILLQISGK